MNKIINSLYLSFREDNRFNTEKVKRTYERFYRTFTADMSIDTANKFFDILADYSSAVEKNAFETGFKTAVQLLMGSMH